MVLPVTEKVLGLRPMLESPGQKHFCLPKYLMLESLPTAMMHILQIGAALYLRTMLATMQ